MSRSARGQAYGKRLGIPPEVLRGVDLAVTIFNTARALRDLSTRIRAMRAESEPISPPLALRWAEELEALEDALDAEVRRSPAAFTEGPY